MNSEEPAAREQAPVSTTMTKLFDLRTVVAVLFGIYGVVLVVLGLVAYDTADHDKAGTNLNLWTGIAMLVLTAGFLVWVRLRPATVPEEQPPESPQ